MKIINSFNLNLSDIPAIGESRTFTINGDNNSEFILEIKDNSTGYYYNFTTSAFASTKSNLEGTIEGNTYQGSVAFPNTITTDVVNGAVTSGVKVIMDNAVAGKMAVGDRVTGNNTLNSTTITVAALNPDGDNANEFSLSSAVVIADNETLSFSGDDQYDIYLHAKAGTQHAPYSEVRFGDGTIDINSSTGSNSLLMQKVVYQYADVTLILRAYNPTSAFTISGLIDSSLTFSRGGNTGKLPFSLACNSASGASFTIKKQPVSSDVLSFLTPTVGAAPETLPGENIYPAISDADTVDGAIAGGGSVVKVVMDNNVATNLVIGDKITTAGGDSVSTDTVDGAVTSGIKVVMDNNVAGKMSVGDQITGNAYLDANIVTVLRLNPDGDNVKEFSMTEAVLISDGVTLTFSPKCNRSLTTVVALNPDGDNVKEFSMSQNIGLVDGVTLQFSNQKNYQWPLDNISSVVPGMIVVANTNVTTGTKVGRYKDTVTLFADTENEKVVIKNSAPALNTKGASPTITKGLVTTQTGNVVFNKQQVVALAGDVLKLGGYGEGQIFNVHGYDVRFTDLAINYKPVTTTTTAASFDSTNVVVAARDGIMNGVSTVSGIGINPSTVATVSSGANATGAGTIVLDKAQTLESGITLTFAGAGKKVVVTGNIEIFKAGTASAVVYLDVEKLLTSA